MSPQTIFSTQHWSPPPTLSISQWADTFRVLSREGSPEAGRWNTDRAPYQRGMMDAIKENERVVIMTAAQVGKTEILLNTIGYYIHYEPCPILIVQPTLQMGEDFSKNKFAPMLRDTPVIASMFTAKTRSSDNNIYYKHFNNSAIVSISGANSPSGLASRSVRVLLCDEVDRYPLSAGNEGDPLSLAMKRTANFWNRRIVWVSTPTMRGTSRIEKAYSMSDMSLWELPCPKCGEYQPLNWENILFMDRTEPVMRCSSCGFEGGERDWKWGAGRWNITNPSGEFKGFHMNALASPWISWEQIVTQYHEAYASGMDVLKVWTNTMLGEPYEPPEDVIDIDTVHDMRELYSCEVPERVKLLTCGVDVQDDRLELEVVGWGANHESWGISYRVIYGSPGDMTTWAKLDEVLRSKFTRIDGTEIMIACTFIDSAGHFTDEVYRYCKDRRTMRVFAIVGRGTFGKPPISNPTRNNRYRIPLFTLGVSTLKGTLYARLNAGPGEAGYCHFPKDEGTGYDDIYFQGLLSEKMVIKRVNGQERVYWETKNRHVRNEPLDCRIYAMGAYELLSPKLDKPPAQEGKPAVKKRARGLVHRGLTMLIS